MDYKGRLREISDLLKCNDINITGVPDDEEREKGAERLFEQTIAENFPNLRRETDVKIQEAHGSKRTPNKFNKSWPSPRHIIVKFTKYTDKERILKAARGKSP